MRFASMWMMCTSLALGACKGEAVRHDAAPTPDVPEVSWWRPSQGETRNWDIQLAPPFALEPPRAMYVLDLWAVSPATTLTYGDGSTVNVPAGPQAGAIPTLHARSPKPIVACYVRTGAVHLTQDPDARKFPGYEANPPNHPTPIKPQSVIGWDTNAVVPDVQERFLDIREAARPRWTEYVWKRLDHAQRIGCDAVAVDHNSMLWADVSTGPHGTGFSLSGERDQTAWFSEVATEAHRRMLSVGHVNGNELAGQVEQLASNYDWMLIERCAENQDCDTVRPFLAMRKAVFAIDYAPDATVTNACPRYGAAMIQEGLIKDVGLTGATRGECPP